MSRNKQSRNYLIDCSYKNDKFDWPFDLVIVTRKNNHCFAVIKSQPQCMNPIFLSQHSMEMPAPI